MKTIFYIAIGIVGVLSSSAGAFCGVENDRRVETPPALDDLGRFVLSAMHSARLGMDTAEYHYIEIKSGKQHHMAYLCDFGNYRMRVRRHSLRVSPGKTSEIYEMARTSEMFVYRNTISQIISINPPHKADITAELIPADIRTFGLGYYADIMMRGTEYPEVWANYQQNAVTSASEVSPNVYELVWHLGGEGPSKLERIMVVDGGRGYWPTRLELRQGDNRSLYLSSDLSLQKFRDTWVPARYEIQSGALSVAIENITWVRLNEEVRADEFAYTAFDRRGIQHVVDNRLGTPVIIARWPQEVNPEVRHTKLYPWFAGGVVVLVVVGAALYWSRSRKKPSG